MPDLMLIIRWQQRYDQPNKMLKTLFDKFLMKQLLLNCEFALTLILTCYNVLASLNKRYNYTTPLGFGVVLDFCNKGSRPMCPKTPGKPDENHVRILRHFDDFRLKDKN